MGVIQAVAAREVLSAARARATIVLLVGVSLIALLVFQVSNSRPEFLPTAVDLLLPFELLVPAVAIALGYHPVAADASRGELDVLETYPVSHWQYVLGVYVGRALALGVVITVPLVLVGGLVATTSAEGPTFIAGHQGADSPLLFVRFSVLTLAFGLTVLAMAIAASALAGRRRNPLLLGIIALAFVVIGLDLLVIRGFASGFVPAGQLSNLLALSPSSAYRGLVFESILSPAIDTGLRQASPIGNALGLLGWTVGSLAVATLAIRR